MDGQSPVRSEGEGRQDPLQIEPSIGGARAVAVAQQVVEPVAVQLAAHQGLDGRGVLGLAGEQAGYGLRAARRKGLKGLPQGRVLLDQPRRPQFMFEAEHLLACVAEGGMAEVMQQGRGIEHPPLGGQLRVVPLQLAQGLTRQLQHPQGVGEAARFGAVEGEKGRPQLADPPQSLEGFAVDQRDGQGFSRLGRLQPDRPMEGVVIDPFPHGLRSPALDSVAAALRPAAWRPDPASRRPRRRG